VIGKRHLTYAQSQPGLNAGETEFERMRIALSLLGFYAGYQLVSGFDPHDDTGQTHRVAFKTTVDGEAVCHVLSYASGLLEKDGALERLGEQMRKGVVWKILLAEREDQEYIEAAVEMYEPGVPFWRACLRHLWRRFLARLSRK